MTTKTTTIKTKKLRKFTNSKKVQTTTQTVCKWRKPPLRPENCTSHTIIATIKRNHISKEHK